MFRFLLRTRTHTETRQSDPIFKTRSGSRDANTDRARVHSILDAIENALRATEQERSGLDRRVEDALARAAVTIGNSTDEYLERDAFDSHHQTSFSAEISSGQRRLKELAALIAHLQFLKTTALNRFPDLGPPSPKN